MTPGDVRVTPGGVAHQTGDEALLGWFGDIEGATTITYRQSHVTPDGSRLIAAAYSDGELTWDGRTGPVRGVSNAVCEADPSAW